MGAGPPLPLLGHLVQSRERLQEAASGWQMLAKVKQQQLTGVEQSWHLWSSPPRPPPAPEGTPSSNAVASGPVGGENGLCQPEWATSTQGWARL